MVNPKRPLLVSIIDTLYIILAIIMIAVGTFVLLIRTVLDADVQVVASLTGGGEVIIGIIYLIMSLGFLK